MYQAQNSFISGIIDAYHPEKDIIDLGPGLSRGTPIAKPATYSEWAKNIAEEGKDSYKDYLDYIDGIYQEVSSALGILPETFNNLSISTKDIIGQALSRANDLTASNNIQT